MTRPGRRRLRTALLAPLLLLTVACTAPSIEDQAADLAAEYRRCVHTKRYETCVQGYSIAATRQFADQDGIMDAHTHRVVADAFLHMSRQEGVIE